MVDVAPVRPRGAGGLLDLVHPLEVQWDAPLLETPESLLRFVFENMAEGFSLHELVYDGDGTPIDFRYLDANTAFEDHTGLSRRETLGRTMTQVNPGTDPAMLQRYINVALTGRGFNHEYRSQTFGRQLRVKAFPAGPGRFATIFEDITDQLESQRALETSNRLDSLGILAGGLAHDFNNLLAGFATRMDLARRSPDLSAVQRHLSTAQQALDRAKDLTRRLLVFSKGGRPDMHPGDLGPVLREAAELSLVGTRCVAHWDLPASLPTTRFDGHQMSQVFHNLFINAVQAMPQGGTIGIAGTVEDQTVRIAVRDTGVGIPKGLHERLFDPFFTTKPGGTGLGLAMVHSIVTKHSGRVQIDSEEGRGTVVTVELPVAPEAGDSSPDPAPVEVHPKESRPGVIVLLDDVALVRESLAELLEDLGYTVMTTAEGSETIELVRGRTEQKLPLDLVLADLTVPGGLGGSEIVGPLAQLDPELPVIAMSGYSESPVLIDPQHYGFRASVRKPIDTPALVALIEVHRKPPPRRRSR